MTPLESQLVNIVQYLIQPLDDHLVSYCHQNSIPYNPSLQLIIDTLQTIVSLLNGGVYSRHNDNDGLNCDDMFTQEEIIHVLYIGLSCAKPDHEIKFSLL
jgi:hypothetical protein